MYIDDDPDDLLVFGESIGLLYPGITVLQASSGEEGLRLLDRLEAEQKPFPRLIVLDMNMPGMGGKQVLQVVRAQEKWQDIAVVIFTTSSSSADVAFCRSFGTPCITKPMSYEDLNEAIREILSHSNIVLP